MTIRRVRGRKRRAPGAAGRILVPLVRRSPRAPARRNPTGSLAALSSWVSSSGSSSRGNCHAPQRAIYRSLVSSVPCVPDVLRGIHHPQRTGTSVTCPLRLPRRSAQEVFQSPGRHLRDHDGQPPSRSVPSKGSKHRRFPWPALICPTSSALELRQGRLPRPQGRGAHDVREAQAGSRWDAPRMSSDLMAGAADRQSDGGPEVRIPPRRPAGTLIVAGDDAVEHAATPGMNSHHQAAVSRGRRNSRPRGRHPG